MLTTAPQIGELREQVDVLTPPATIDTHGGRTGTWGTLDTGIWARVRAVTNLGEQLLAASVVAQTKYEVVIRYRADVTPKMRIAWIGRTFEIHGAAPMDSGAGVEWLVLDCSEVA